MSMSPACGDRREVAILTPEPGTHFLIVMLGVKVLRGVSWSLAPAVGIQDIDILSEYCSKNSPNG
ncbi:hypothetical protein ACQZ6F_27440 [Rhizobium sp. A22-96]